MLVAYMKVIIEIFFFGQKKQNGCVSFGNGKRVIEEHTESTEKLQ